MFLKFIHSSLLSLVV